MRTGDLPLRCKSYHWDNLGHGKNCLVCPKEAPETMEHLLSDCESVPRDDESLYLLEEAASKFQTSPSFKFYGPNYAWVLENVTPN